MQDGVPAISAADRRGTARYRGGSEARLLDWLSDGTLLVAVRARGARPAAAAAPARRRRGEPFGAPGGALRARLRHSLSAATAVAYLGDEPGQAVRRCIWPALADGETRAAAAPRARIAGAPAWAHDGRQLAFSATLRDGQDSDLYVLDTDGHPRRGSRLAAQPAAPMPGRCWHGPAPTARCWCGTRSPTPAMSCCWWTLTSGALRRIDAPGERSPGYGHIGEARLTSDGRGVYFTSDRDSDHAQLRYVDFYAGNAATCVAPDLEVEHFDVSANNRTRGAELE